MTHSILLKSCYCSGSTLILWLSICPSTWSDVILQGKISQTDSAKLTSEITKVNELRDISPQDWAYEALRNLSNRHGCISGFPDQTYKGSQSISRYQFAVGLNSCLNNIQHLVTLNQTIVKEDINLINRLTQEFAPELAALNIMADSLGDRLTWLEDNQFSTTTKFTAEAVFGLASVLTGSKDDGELDIERTVVLGNTITLELETSFIGEDALSLELEAANFSDFADTTATFSGELSFSGSSDNSLELNLLSYTLPLGDNLELIIGATGLAADDIAETINFLEGDNGGDGAISNFGGLNPIYETAEDAGLGIIYELGEIIEISAGYLASPANQPTEEGGIFNAPYGAIAQAIVSPSDRLDLAFTYIHSRDQSDTNAGTNLANLQSFTEDEFGEAVPTVSNSYGIEFSYELNDYLVIGGWGGLSKVTTLSSLEGQIELGTQDVWNWAITLAFRDLVKEGNVGGIVIGAEPWVTDSSIDTLGQDEDISLHLEAFYQYRLTDNIAITPGIVWITAPDNNNENDNLVIGAIRTTFTF